MGSENRMEENVAAGENSENSDSRNAVYYSIVDKREDLRNTYKTYTKFRTDFVTYQKKTLQTFVVINSKKLPLNPPQQASLQHKKLIYECVHHTSYARQGSGSRVFTQSRRQNCAAQIYVAAVPEVTAKNGDEGGGT